MQPSGGRLVLLSDGLEQRISNRGGSGRPIPAAVPSALKIEQRTSNRDGGGGSSVPWQPRGEWSSGKRPAEELGRRKSLAHTEQLSVGYLTVPRRAVKIGFARQLGEKCPTISQPVDRLSGFVINNADGLGVRGDENGRPLVDPSTMVMNNAQGRSSPAAGKAWSGWFFWRTGLPRTGSAAAFRPRPNVEAAFRRFALRQAAAVTNVCAMRGCDKASKALLGEAAAAGQGHELGVRGCDKESKPPLELGMRVGEVQFGEPSRAD